MQVKKPFWFCIFCTHFDDINSILCHTFFRKRKNFSLFSFQRFSDSQKKIARASLPPLTTSLNCTQLRSTSLTTSLTRSMRSRKSISTAWLAAGPIRIGALCGMIKEYIGFEALCRHSFECPSRALVVMRDGTLASGCRDKNINLCDPMGAHPDQIVEHPGVYSLNVQLDGKLLVGGGHGVIRVLRIPDYVCMQELKGGSGPVLTLAAMSHNRLASGATDCTVRVWDLTAGTCVGVLEGHEFPAFALEMLPSGLLASGSGDGTIRLWDTTLMTCINVLAHRQSGRLHLSRRVNALALLSNGNLASASSDTTVSVWDPIKGVCLQTLHGHRYSIWSLVVLPGGLLASGSSDTVCVWDPIKGDCMMQFTHDHNNSIMNVAVLPGGELVTSSGNKAYVWV